MSIDRHNYEEFFILYWDNELSASQKQAVENFVKANPDLQEEFNILGDTRFTPDNNVQLTAKEFLFNDSFINVTNYEEQLLNYIDDELTTEQNAEVEKAVAKYPSIKKELATLYKTKLQPESAIVFPDKSVLYRREEKVRVISLTWFRVAVAAALILIAGFITFRLTTANKSADNPEVAVNNPGNNSSPATNQLKDQPGDENKQDASTDIVNQNEKKEKTAPVQPTIEKKALKPVDDKLKNVLALEEHNKNNLPPEGDKTQQVIALKANPETITLSETPIEEEKNFGTAQKNESQFAKNDVTIKSRQTSDIETPDIVSAKEKDGGGLKEFLRKTTRVFERRTKIQTTTDDNKLLLGAFAVSLK